MLRKKSIYRKELDSYMCVSQFCARLDQNKIRRRLDEEQTKARIITVITKTLRIQKKEDTKDKKNTLYIVVIQIDASLKENVLTHKKDVDSRDVCNTKKCVCHRNLLTIHNTKKCVCLEDNRS